MFTYPAMKLKNKLHLVKSWINRAKVEYQPNVQAHLVHP